MRVSHYVHFFCVCFFLFFFFSFMDIILTVAGKGEQANENLSRNKPSKKLSQKSCATQNINKHRTSLFFSFYVFLFWFLHFIQFFPSFGALPWKKKQMCRYFFHLVCKKQDSNQLSFPRRQSHSILLLFF